MGKPRHIGRGRPKRGRVYEPDQVWRAMMDLTPVERAATDTNLWFALLVQSQKERWVVEGLRRNGLLASFTPLTQSERRSTAKKQKRSFLVRNVARMPGYVFVGIPEPTRESDEAEWMRECAIAGEKEYNRFFDAILSPRDVKIADLDASFRLPGLYDRLSANLGDREGNPLVHDYVKDPTGRPIRFAPNAMTRMMALSEVPLYSDEEGATARYRPADPTEILEKGDAVIVAGTLLDGLQGVLEKLNGHEATVLIGGKPVFIPAQNLRKGSL